MWARTIADVAAAPVQDGDPALVFPDRLRLGSLDKAAPHRGANFGVVALLQGIGVGQCGLRRETENLSQALAQEGVAKSAAGGDVQLVDHTGKASRQSGKPLAGQAAGSLAALLLDRDTGDASQFPECLDFFRCQVMVVQILDQKGPMVLVLRPEDRFAPAR